MEPIPVIIPKSMTGQEELVVLPKREYERLTKKRDLPTFVGYETHTWKGKKYQIPVYQLHGKSSERLDREVREAIREHEAGKTRKIKSLADLD